VRSLGYLIFCHSYERPASKCQLRNVLTYLPLEREDFFIFCQNCQRGGPQRSASVYNLREMTPLPSPYPFTPPALIIAERSFLPPPQRREQDQRGRGWHCRQGGRRWLACCGAATRSILEAGLLPDGVADVAKVATLECAPGTAASCGATPNVIPRCLSCPRRMCHRAPPTRAAPGVLGAEDLRLVGDVDQHRR
jgi:hypothetical protein